MSTTINHNDMTREELIAYIAKLETDSAFGCLKREAAEQRVSSVSSTQAMIFIDIANMHGMNHVYTMSGVDARIRSMLAVLRNGEFFYKHGGDEIIVICDASAMLAVLNRIERAMLDNDMSAVYAVLIGANDLSLTECVERCDSVVMAKKLELERNGLKQTRDEEYRRMPSCVVRA